MNQLVLVRRACISPHPVKNFNRQIVFSRTFNRKVQFSIRYATPQLDSVTPDADFELHPAVTYQKKSRLRQRAQNLDRLGKLCTVQVGKNGLSDSFVNMLGDAFERKGFVKIRVLEACRMELDEISAFLELRTGCICLLRIGSALFMYRNPTLPQAEQSISPDDEEKREIMLINQTLEMEKEYRQKQKQEKKVQKLVRQQEARLRQAEKRKQRKKIAAAAKQRAEEDAKKEKPEIFRIIEEDWG
eukprot:TRINITY_DN3944_c0_g1_i1.p1 TRINITY_DN3944_c0_g1~~TRINITY_DN3944_c0_g1_i1.p1  ORF type:complete len:244 (+),score=23.31 TRINITY_DN3944_c0_g1_i1:207-938(+)